LRRESRDARKIRYSASQIMLSTKSVMIDMKTGNFFCNLQKNHSAKHRAPSRGRFSNGIFALRIVSRSIAPHRKRAVGVYARRWWIAMNSRSNIFASAAGSFGASPIMR